MSRKRKQSGEEREKLTQPPVSSSTPMHDWCRIRPRPWRTKISPFAETHREEKMA